MSLRKQARGIAQDAMAAAVAGLFGFIEHRIEWRRANALELALEAGAMIDLLTDDPGFVAFRRARINHWRRIERKHRARAMAQDELRELGERCGLEACTEVP